MSWSVVEPEPGNVHVVPWDDAQDRIHEAHKADVACDCRPSPLKDSPFGEPVWSHHEPSWPGSSDYLT